MICIDMYRSKLSSEMIKIGEKVLLIVDRGWLVATPIGAIGSSVANKESLVEIDAQKPIAKRPGLNG